jgi:hypothetical protein
LLVAGKNIGGFAQQIGISSAAAKELLAEDPTKFAEKFASSLNGLAPDKLASKLDELKIGSQETIKVLGALGAGSERLATLQGVASDAFEKGTSLTKEYNTKNNNTAANIAKFKNVLESISIVFGQQLLPVINQVIGSVVPLAKTFGDWAANSPKLASNLVFVAEALGAIWLISKLVSFWTYASSVAMGVLGATSGIASIAIGSNAVAMGAYNMVAGVMTVVTWLLNSALVTMAVSVLAAALPIIAIVAAVLAVIYIFLYWDEICVWFSSQWTNFTNFLGTTWDSLVQWFEEFSFADFFQNIGASIIDFLLLPLKSVLFLLSKLPGKVGDLSKLGLDELSKATDLHVKSEENPLLDSPSVASQKATNQSIVTKQNTVKMDITDKGGNIGKVSSQGPLDIPIKTSSTTSSKNWNNK